MHQPQNKKDNRKKHPVNIESLKEEKRFHQGIDDIFGEQFDQLNLDQALTIGYKKDALNQLFKEVVLQRAAQPDSKRQC